MDVEKQINYWRELAKSDFITAEILLSKQRILHGLFFCHLSIEKALKAEFCRACRSFAPKTHNLIFLSNSSNLTLTSEQADFLGVLMKYQLEGRYPDSPITVPDLETANQYFIKTKELLEWLTQK